MWKTPLADIDDVLERLEPLESHGDYANNNEQDEDDETSTDADA